METQKNRRKNIYALCQSAIFIALATILSFLPVYEMPMGGSVTLASMLPILFIGVKFGPKWGLGSAFVYALIQLGQALVKGNVFIYCVGATAVIICVLFDYIVPFSILGFSFFASAKKDKSVSLVRTLIVFGIIIFVRFLCHFITGMTIWGQWDDGFLGAFIYSVSYNGSYMLPELILTLVVTAFLLSSRRIEKLLEKEN
jgi:thiamine transporter